MVDEDNNNTDGFADISELLSEVVVQIQFRMSNPNALAGVSTGFDDFDKYSSGLRGGDLVVLAGRPGMGENILALNIAEHVALVEKLPVAILDAGRGINLSKLLLASNAKINYYDLFHGKIDEEQSARLSMAVDTLKLASIHIASITSVSVQDVADRLRMLIQKMCSLGLVIIDCLPELKLTGEITNKVQAHEIAMVSRSLKALAQELNVPIIVLSPINRDLEERVNKRPQIVDLPCGGAIASAADLVLCVYRDSIYNCDSSDCGVAEIIIVKNNNGSAGSFLLKYSEQYLCFEREI